MTFLLQITTLLLYLLLRNFYSDFEIKIFGRFEVFAGC
jgi:hypothetical protein